MARAYDARFTDRDVRETPILEGYVRRYLEAYGGDFDFLVRAKMALADAGELPVGTVRGVLNCMRSDPSYRTALPVGLVPREPRPLKAVEIRRPARVLLRTRWKKTYATSSWRLSVLSHYLDKEKTELWWYPHTGTYQWFPHVKCNAQLSKDLVVLTDEIPAGRRECSRCLAVMREHGLL